MGYLRYMMNSFRKKCVQCGRQKLYAYTVKRNKIYCLPCLTNEGQSNKSLVKSIKAIRPLEAPLGYLTVTEKHQIQRNWELDAHKHGWDN